MEAYDPADDSRRSYDAAIEAKRLRGDTHDWEGRPWKRMEQIGDCTLYLGNCLEILPTLGNVDAVVTDPPYEREAHDPGRRLNGRTVELRDRRRREIYAQPLAFAAMSPELRVAVATHFGRLSQGWVLVFCQAEAVQIWREVLEQAGAAYRRPMIWVKPDSAPQLSGDRPAMGYESIVAAWAGDGRSRWNGGGRRGVFVHGKSDPGFGHGGMSNEHQTRKPIALMNDLVSLFSQPSDVVLDPFMGSGTTGVACVKSGRKFIGIEIDEGYFGIACERIRKAYAQPDMFIEPRTPEPKQEAML